MPVNTVSYADYHRSQVNSFQGNRQNNTRSKGNKQIVGPTGWRCRARQLEPRLDIVTRGKPVAVDCEGVTLLAEIGDEKNGCASVSVANEEEELIYDTFVHYPAGTPHVLPPKHLNLGVLKPDILPENGAQPIAKVLKDLEMIFNKAGKVVAHSLGSDMKMLRGLPWQNWALRDTQQVIEWRRYARNGNTPALKDLASNLLKRDIQTKKHSSAEDAKATMALYQLNKDSIERQQSMTLTDPGAAAYSEELISRSPSVATTMPNFASSSASEKGEKMSPDKAVGAKALKATATATAINTTSGAQKQPLTERKGGLSWSNVVRGTSITDKSIASKPQVVKTLAKSIRTAAPTKST